MSYMVRHTAGLVLAALIGLAPRPAHAWIETQIRSYGATVDVEADGKAVIAHELVISVRGGPLKRFELPGVDADAEPLPDATVTPTVTGAASLPLLVERRDDQTLLLEVDHEKGLRSGRYAFAFRYRTNLLQRGLIQRRPTYAELRWVSPRFEQGVDSMRVLLRLPPAPTAPVLPSYDESDPEAPFGAFISTLRRAPEKDELEIVRPHVAKNEAVVWRAHVSPGLLPQSEAGQAESVPFVRPTPAGGAPVGRPLGWWAIAASVAFAYGLLVWLKSRAFARACVARDARARPLLPLPIGLRAPLAGITAAGAVALALPLASPTLAALALLVSLALASLRAPELRPLLRGPGQWLPLQESEAFQRVALHLPGRLLDSSTLPGFVCFVLGLCAAVGAAASLLSRSPYEALLALLASAVLLPLFSTGRSVDLPAHPLAHGRTLARLAQRLKRRPATRVVPWARVGDADGQPDELRLLVQPKPSPDGLVALEVGVECVRGLGGAVASPYVLVRVKESASQLLARLPRRAVWTRGRKPDERVTILRPALPTLRSCQTLVEGLLERLDQPSKPASSRGSSERTSKLSRVPSPAHAM
jgi:hypothetical protein